MEDQPANVYRTRVRSYQTDLNGAMYHGAYLDIFDDARIETFRRLDYTYERFAAAGWNLIIRHVDLDFLRPARMDDQIAITVLVERLTPATMTARYECRRDVEVLSVGHVVYAFLDMLGKPVRVPADLRQLIAAKPFLNPETTSR